MFDSQSTHEAKKEVMKQKEIAGELVKMGLEDQKMRLGHQNPNIRAKFDENVDIRNVKRLREIIEAIGWPTIDKVGEVASYAAWLVVQHADLDPDFQEKCLELVKKAFKKGLVDSVCTAYLEDRVAVNRGKEQTHGTQFCRDQTGNVVPRPIKDAEHLEKKRKQMGLEPFSVYEQKMKGQYKYAEGQVSPMIGGVFYKVS